MHNKYCNAGQFHTNAVSVSVGGNPLKSWGRGDNCEINWGNNLAHSFSGCSKREDKVKNDLYRQDYF